MIKLPNISIKKSLGQYFSGSKVADLLVSLTKAEMVSTAIDPMCGSGDMLSAIIKRHGSNVRLTGIEIDPDICEKTVEKFEPYQGVEVRCHNAFEPLAISSLNNDGYELVITNPPYVRHEAANRHLFHSALTITEIRRNLKKIASESCIHTEVEKNIFQTIIDHFSGRADLAVPSWILCSLLVKRGGQLAMVLPSSWLTRDYALIIEYLLLRLFKLDYLIEDAESSWFDNAQVKTILLVATRIPANESISDWKNDTFRYAHLYNSGRSSDSLTGNIPAFVDLVKTDLLGQNGLESSSILVSDTVERLKLQITDKQWFAILEPNFRQRNAKSLVHKETSRLKHWLADVNCEFVTLSEFGAEVGQGMRTGANIFFYAKVISEGTDHALVILDKAFSSARINIPKELLRQVIRKQSELENEFSTARSFLTSVLLYIQDAITSEDYDELCRISRSAAKEFQILPEMIAKYIELASKTVVQSGGKDITIPSLSAVRTNVRRYDVNSVRALPRFWYMLPALAKRHKPDLFLPRVNGGRIKTRLNSQGSIVDANFSTIWLNNKAKVHDVYSLLALLNSTYAVTAMEEYGTVMGGGALKLEATQIKRIPFPKLPLSAISKLSQLGKKLSKANGNAEKLISDIDHIVIEGMNFEKTVADKLDELNNLYNRIINNRN